MRARLVLASLLAAALPACASDPVACEVDADCPEGGRCIVESGVAFCGCATDAVCPEDAFCNAAGRCQRKPSCRSNVDCEEGTFCDAGLGVCVTAPGCRRTVHCPIGEVCVSDAVGCAPGCESSADCPLGQVCDPEARDEHPHGLGACALGCERTAGCPLGQRCVGGRCFESPNQSHCAPCDEGLACPYETDWCLVNPAFDPARPVTGGAFQCGVDCEGRPEICPNGYVCGDVVRLTGDPCEIDAQCPGVRRCVVGEGEARGFCSCARNEDCSYAEVPPTCTLAGCLYPPGRLCGEPSECEPVARCDDHDRTGVNVCYRNRDVTCDSYLDCLCVEGRCVRDDRPCDTGADCEPTCTDGRCRIGAACSPEEGLYCSDLR